MVDVIFGKHEVYTTPLRRISHPKGDILHALKSSDDGFSNFGEAYFSIVHKHETKGWKKHQRMTMNLVVPSGDVRFSIFSEAEQRTKTVELGSRNYQRLTVQPGFWVAFKGLGDDLNLLLNIASLEHDPDEAVNADLARFPLEAVSCE